MTDEEWLMCAQVLETFYPHNFKVSNVGKLELWFQMLSDLPGERVIAAIRYMVKTQPAFPSVADIRKLAEPAPADPGEAWRQACDYVSRLRMGPRYQDGRVVPAPELEPWIKAAAESVGFEVIRYRTPDAEGTLRAHFIRFYDARLSAQRREAAGLGAPLLPTFEPIDLGDAVRSIGRSIPA